jgi:LPS-assembly protein
MDRLKKSKNFAQMGTLRSTVKVIIPPPVALLLPFFVFGSVKVAEAQLPPPNRLEVFLGDSQVQRDANQAQAQKSLKPAEKPTDTLDFQAEHIEVRKEEKKISGTGGIVMSQRGVQVQADAGTVNTETKDGEVSGNVVMSTSEGLITAQSGTVNLDNETADFKDAQFTIEPGGYEMTAGRALKLSEFEFELDDSSATTCQCEDGAKPWELLSDRCHITKEGYAHTYGTTVKFEGLPIFYSPWLAFPVKTERASGLLTPTSGGTSQDGFRWRQPLFLVLDDSTDLTITPFIDTSSRMGSSAGFRTKFSSQSDIDTRLYYSDESRRGSSLRGVDVTGMSDPTIDTHRFGGYYKQNWAPDPKDLDIPIQFVADGHFTSDNLMVREIQDPDVGLFNSQFLSSVAVVRGIAFSEINAEARTEYTQMLQTPQEAQPQRLPELSLSNSQTFRPFGFNPYGVKIVASGAATATNFDRDIGGAGWRYITRPKVAVPFHLSNYVSGQFAAELSQINYQLNDTFMGEGIQELDSSNSFTVPIVGFGLKTGIERAYQIEEDSWLPQLVALGATGNDLRLTKIKHTIEPFVNYTYVPDVTQSDLPQFDQNDSNRHRSVYSYGFTTRLMGRMQRPYERSRTVGELSPSAETLPMFDLSSSTMQFGRSSIISPIRNVAVRDGQIRELASLSIRQTFDYVEESRDKDPLLNGFSDFGIGATLSPSQYLTTGIVSNYSGYDNDFTSFSYLLGMKDDREDAIRLRYQFQEGSHDQLEGNFEAKVSEQLRLGYYGRYDLRESEFFENRGLLRFINACKCWSLDLGFGNQLNPDNRQLLLTFTFSGLGDITQAVGLAPRNNQVAQ